jgi:hypothetical protein
MTKAEATRGKPGTIPNVKKELRKLSKSDKVELRQYCESANGSSSGCVFEASDEEGDDPDDGYGGFDGLDITQAVEGQHFTLLRAALLKKKSKEDNMLVHSMQVMIDKHYRINEMLKQELNLHLDADTMYLIVFGVSGRLSTFSSLIEMARNPVEDFGKYGKEDTLSMGTDGSLKREKVVTDVRSKTALRTCEDWEKATLYFQSVLNAWHPGMARYTASMPAEMLKRKIQSGNDPGACLKLLERMWDTWCTSLTRAISVATADGFRLCDIAFHYRYHVKVLEEDKAEATPRGAPTQAMEIGQTQAIAFPFECDRAPGAPIGPRRSAPSACAETPATHAARGATACGACAPRCDPAAAPAAPAAAPARAAAP